MPTLSKVKPGINMPSQRLELYAGKLARTVLRGLDGGNLVRLPDAGVHWGIDQPRSATASTAGGHTAERVEMSDISFSKLADLSSPILAQTCAMGKTIPKAKLEFFRADGNGDRVKYFEVELENVLVGMVKPHMGGDQSLLTETVNLKYSKIKWKYTQQKIGGGSGGNTAGGWDLAANKVA